MEYQEIEALIALKESKNLEFKESTGQLDRSMETLCAFLNGDGGIVLYGIKDNGNVVGQEVSDSTKRAIAEAINRIEPFVSLEINYVRIPNSDKFVIIVNAEKQRFMRPFAYKGRAYLRMATSPQTCVLPSLLAHIALYISDRPCRAFSPRISFA